MPPRTHQTRAGCQEYTSVWGAGATGAETGAGWGGGEANLFCVKLWGKYQMKRPKSRLTEKKPHCRSLDSLHVLSPNHLTVIPQQD